MTESESLEAAIQEKVAIVDWDPAWPARFDAERDRLLEALPGAFIAIEHIGSTAVPGLAAKPLIDLLAGVESMAKARALGGPICDSGYATSGDFNASLDDRQWFMRHADGHRTHHLHVVVHGSEAWHDRVGFRDALRADPALAARYARLKAALVARHGDDREAYTDAKAGFIREALDGRDL